MGNEPKEVERHYFARWVRHTFFGWLLGFVMVIVLAIAWDVVGGGAQFMVGVGMGAGVGYAQWRLARHWFDADRRWVWASVIGMGTPFVLGDIVAAVGVQVPYSLALYVVMGGLLVGLMQRRLLSPTPTGPTGGCLPASRDGLFRRARLPWAMWSPVGGAAWRRPPRCFSGAPFSVL